MLTLFFHVRVFDFSLVNGSLGLFELSLHVLSNQAAARCRWFVGEKPKRKNKELEE
jgi:hypothetical protein